jgi:hypothetical protein
VYSREYRRHCLNFSIVFYYTGLSLLLLRFDVLPDSNHSLRLSLLAEVFCGGGQLCLNKVFSESLEILDIT